MFIRAQVSSQLASIADMLITIFLTSLFGIYYVIGTFVGAVCGGIVNCAINYKWTFKSDEVRKRYIVIKYAIIWVGSILLNTWGTYLLTEFLDHSNWVNNHFSAISEYMYIFAKLFVSLMVGFIWNYNLQRIFVYRNVEIKRFFTRKNKDNNKVTKK